MDDALATVTTARLVLRRVHDEHRAYMCQMDADVAVVGADGLRSSAEHVLYERRRARA